MPAASLLAGHGFLTHGACARSCGVSLAAPQPAASGGGQGGTPLPSQDQMPAAPADQLAAKEAYVLCTGLETCLLLLLLAGMLVFCRIHLGWLLVDAPCLDASDWQQLLEQKMVAGSVIIVFGIVYATAINAFCSFLRAVHELSRCCRSE
ncbi:hypothetical protein ABPG75_007141 [Micractinium tetrahymenae]